MEEQLLNLIQSGEQVNIELAFELAKAQSFAIDALLNKYFRPFIYPYSNQQISRADVCTLFQSEQLHFSLSIFTAIPSSIRYFKKAKSLTLVGSKTLELTAAIGELQQLKILRLGANQIARFPQSLQELRGLEELDLSNNKFSSLPPILEEMSQLKLLNLQFNAIEHINWLPDCMDSLEILLLNNTNLREIPSKILTYPQLKAINIQQTPLAYRIDKAKIPARIQLFS